MAAWQHAEWEKGRVYNSSEPISDIALREIRFEGHLSHQPIPSTYVAVDSGEPVGSASLVYYQLSHTNKPTPWLTNVYVLPSYRRQGIAQKLIKTIQHLASISDFDELYLYTSSSKNYYLKRGWQWRQKSYIQERNVDVLVYHT